MDTKNLRYRTPLTAKECIAAITTQPWEYGDSLTPLWYHCGEVGAQSVLITFRGGKFRKMMQTRYLVTFLQEQERTIVTLKFRDEMFGLPPMTPIMDIDLFMSDKLRATRIP